MKRISSGTLLKKNLIFFLLPFVFFILIAPVATLQASQPTTTDRFFLQAEHFLKRQQWKKAQPLLQRLSSHPLYPYLALRLLTQQEYPEHAMHDFLKKTGFSYLSQQLLYHWFFHWASEREWSILSKHKDWVMSLAKDPPTPDSQDNIACAFSLWAMMDPQTAPPHAAPPHELFQKQDLFSPVCAKLFQKALSQGLISEHSLQEKIERDVRQEHLHTLRWLIKTDPRKAKKLFPDTEQILRKNRVRLTENPKKIGNGAFLVFWFKQMMGEEKKANLYLYKKISAQKKLNPLDAFEIEKTIALELATQYDPDLTNWLKRPALQKPDRTLHEWQIRQLLKEENWKSLIALLEKNPTPYAENFDRYWLARAHQEVGSKAKARTLFKSLLSQTHYYAFLSHFWTQEKIPFQPTLPHFTRQELSAFEKKAVFQRIRSLRQLGRQTLAVREWQFNTRYLSSHQKALAAQLAINWQWYPMAIATTKPTSPEHPPLALHYPLAFEQSVFKSSRLSDLHPAWIFAISRQESYFSPAARSPKGALGLMQMKLETAREMGLSRGSLKSRREKLFDPEINLKLGSQFFKKLMERYQNNPILAAAAYNAGPTHVRDWLEPHANQTPFDVWIETIPFRETRNYLKNVITHAIIYEKTLKAKKGRDPGRDGLKLTQFLKPMAAITTR